MKKNSMEKEEKALIRMKYSLLKLKKVGSDFKSSYF